MQRLYSLAWWLAMPLVMFRLWRRGKAEPGYRRHIGERLGFYLRLPEPAVPLLWLHAVSVGETRAAEPLIDALLERYPDHALLLTHMTPTGRATGRDLFARHGRRVIQSYLPYDTGWMTCRFLRHFRPRLGVLMETEVWPSLIAQCARMAVPVALVNARLSERSLRKGRRFARLMQPAAAALSCVAAQTPADAERLRDFGAREVTVTGSIKFDVTPPDAMLETGAQWRRQIGARPVLLCASTREGEEKLILSALLRAHTAFDDVAKLADVTDPATADGPPVPVQGCPLLIIVPRHPQRFDEVAHLIAAQGLSVVRRSTLGNARLAEQTDVLLGDTMGEMFAYYSACDLAFIGGSLLPLGGQNLIEACAVGKPVIIGPHTFNFMDVSEDAVAAGAAVRVADVDELWNRASHLLANEPERLRMGERALSFARQHRGATARTVALLAPWIERGRK